mgnify:CR=1 FL=1
MIQKNEEYIVDIIDNGINGEGIAKINNFTIFVKEAIKGEKVKIHILKVNSNFAYAKIIEIISASNERRNPFCSAYKMCGGCNLQYMSYEETLRVKQNYIKNTLQKALPNYNFFIEKSDIDNDNLNKGDNSIEIKLPIGMIKPKNYRNKVQYPVRNGKIGFYKDRTHEIIENEYCFIQDENIDKLSKKAFELLIKFGNTCYDEVSKKR